MIAMSAKSMISSYKCSKRWGKLSKKLPKNSLRKSAVYLPKSSVARPHLPGEPCGAAQSRYLALSAGHTGAFFGLIPGAETIARSFVLKREKEGDKVNPYEMARQPAENTPE